MQLKGAVLPLLQKLTRVNVLAGLKPETAAIETTARVNFMVMFSCFGSVFESFLGGWLMQVMALSSSSRELLIFVGKSLTHTMDLGDDDVIMSDVTLTKSASTFWTSCCLVPIFHPMTPYDAKDDARCSHLHRYKTVRIASQFPIGFPICEYRYTVASSERKESIQCCTQKRYSRSEE
jgi:hypothetical protein